MLSWFDIAYLVLDIAITFYCFKSYYVSKKKAFQFFGLGFIFLILSDFLWVFAIIPWPDSLLSAYGYMRLGLYTIFILLILHALQHFNTKPETSRE